MKITNRIALAMLTSFTIFNVPAVAKITVQHAGQMQHFSEPVRLEQVLAPLVSSEIYWPATVLYKQNHQQAEALRSQTLVLLEQLQQTARPQLQQQLLQLANSIKTWQLAQPLPFEIDYDLARISIDHNPLLLPGEYYLQMGARPDSILVIGAVKGASVSLAHLPAAALPEYLSQLTLQSADINQVFLKQADRRLLTVKLAGANAPYQEAQPGAVMIVPFKSGVFNRDFAKLNQLLVELVQYKVVV